ncbi:MAG: hypothetical protein JSS72_12220 [Armatimonadetes bacterium]|nr:hypothetical protein [Armatimonadota bacterium]
MRPIFTCLVLATLVGALAAQAPGPVGLPPRAPKNEVLQGMPPIVRLAFRAGPTTRFVGVRRVQSEKNVFTQRVFKDGRKIRSEFLDGSSKGTIIVDSGRDRRIYRPKQNRIELMPGGGDMAGLRPQMLLATIERERMSPTISDGGFVAGFTTQLATFTRPNAQVGVRMWIDPSTGAVLKFDAFRPDGSLAAHFEYVSIDYKSAIDPNSFTLNMPGVKEVTQKELVIEEARKLGLTPVILNLPGYVLTHQHVLKRKESQALIQLYRGPRGPIMLGQTLGNLDPSAFKERPKRPHENVYLWKSGRETLVLIGELSIEQLQQSSRSVTAAGS